MSDPSTQPVELDLLQGTGPLWGMASEDLNATLLGWKADEGVDEHSNPERDVLIVVLDGSALVIVDGNRHLLHGHDALLVPKGARRRITAGADGARYLSVHLRRGPLQIAS